jgi:hypothetical protein
LRISIQIERLVVDGIDLQRSQRPWLQAAFEQELMRLLVQKGLHQDLASGVAVPRLNAPAIEVHPKTKPQVLGQQIAQAVHRGIGQ